MVGASGAAVVGEGAAVLGVEARTGRWRRCRALWRACTTVVCVGETVLVRQPVAAGEAVFVDEAALVVQAVLAGEAVLDRLLWLAAAQPACSNATAITDAMLPRIFHIGPPLAVPHKGSSDLVGP